MDKDELRTIVCIWNSTVVRQISKTKRTRIRDSMIRILINDILFIYKDIKIRPFQIRISDETDYTAYSLEMLTKNPF